MESYNLYIFISMWLIAYGLTRAALAELFRKAGVAWYLALAWVTAALGGTVFGLWRDRVERRVKSSRATAAQPGA